MYFGFNKLFRLVMIDTMRITACQVIKREIINPLLFLYEVTTLVIIRLIAIITI